MKKGWFNTMKKTLALLLALLMLTATFVACENGSDKPGDEIKDDITTTGTTGAPGSEDAKTDTPTTAAPTDPPETDEPYVAPDKIVPNNAWGNATKENPHPFTLGSSIDAQPPAEVINLTDMRFLEFDLYVEDPDTANSITGQTQLEISSGGACDVEEYNWGQNNENQLLANIELVQGWNHIKIALPEVNDWWDCDYTAVNYLRWYYVGCDKTAEAQIANFCFTKE